jgi:hypothetical protein
VWGPAIGATMWSWRIPETRAWTGTGRASPACTGSRPLPPSSGSRRRRLDVYRRSPDWPGKETAQAFEFLNYDRRLVMAATMLDVPAPHLADRSPLAPEARAALEDRLAHAGLNVHGRNPGSGDVFSDYDLII